MAGESGTEENRNIYTVAFESEVTKSETLEEKVI